MSDIFISYARSNEALAKQAGDALRQAGYDVWRDDEMPDQGAYNDVIEERIKAARAVLVLWSTESVGSRWVRAEADVARELGTLVQASLDVSLPPAPFNQIQCTDLFGWTGDRHWPAWARVESSLATLVSPVDARPAPAEPAVVCVLPFVNLSGDDGQDYFSDGISEDILTDLSRVSALSVIARNVTFALKGKPVDRAGLKRDHGATHVLEGSVRKVGTRVRINARLSDCAGGQQVWADHYDRDVSDIFAVEDEISKAVVGALKLKLLAGEKRAIERRGTHSPEAYGLYLQARRQWDDWNTNHRRAELVIGVCRQALAIDAGYAHAWSLLALAQTDLRFWHGKPEDGREAAERALSIDPDLAEAHCVKARYLQQDGRIEDANRALETALRLDPGSWEVNKEGAFMLFRQGRIAEAVPHFEKAVTLMDADYHSAGMLITCYAAVDDQDALLRVAKIAFARVENALVQDPRNSKALGLGAAALGAMGGAERTRAWINRAMLVNPDNISQRYNLACALTASLKDDEGALDLLAPYFEQALPTQVEHAEVDPDMNRIRDVPRFKAMVAAARTRLALEPA